VTFYGLSLLLTTTMLLVLWRHAVWAHLVRPDYIIPFRRVSASIRLGHKRKKRSETQGEGEPG